MGWQKNVDLRIDICSEGGDGQDASDEEAVSRNTGRQVGSEGRHSLSFEPLCAAHYGGAVRYRERDSWQVGCYK